MCAALGRLFTRLLGDADARDLGHGVWRQDHDRFRRAVDRCHQQLEALRAAPAGAPPGAEDVGSAAAGLLDRVREVCVRAQRLVPSRDATVPGGFGGAPLDVHRGLSRAGTLVAEAAEALVMGRPEVAARAVDRAGEEIGRAERSLDSIGHV